MDWVYGCPDHPDFRARLWVTVLFHGELEHPERMANEDDQVTDPTVMGPPFLQIPET